jgi:predicted enzyme related to lactoylglutathione lyase
MIAVTAGALMIPQPARAIEAGRIHPGGAMGAPIVYFEIAGPETQALKSFYSAVFAWEIDANATIAAASTGGVRGGLRQDPPEKLLYLGVPSIDETLKHIETAGGKTIAPRTVVPGVVTFALFSDPAGNRMGLAEFGSYK